MVKCFYKNNINFLKGYLMLFTDKRHKIIQQFERDKIVYEKFSSSNLRKLEIYYTRQLETKKLFLTFYTIVCFSVFVSNMTIKLYHLFFLFFYNVILHQGITDISKISNSAQFVTKIVFIFIILIVLSIGIQMIWNISDVMRKKDVISLEIKFKENQRE